MSGRGSDAAWPVARSDCTALAMAGSIRGWSRWSVPSVGVGAADSADVVAIGSTVVPAVPALGSVGSVGSGGSVGDELCVAGGVLAGPSLESLV